MKVIAICGSPRTGGNTEEALEIAAGPIRAAGIEVEMVLLAEKSIGPCVACGKCAEGVRCETHQDDLNPIVEKVRAAEGLILGSPVYFGAASGQLTNFYQRLGYISRRKEKFLSRKVGGAVVVGRRGGLTTTYEQLSLFFTLNDMIQVGSSYWNIVYANVRGQTSEDHEGVETLRRFGENFAWVMQKLYGSPEQR